MKVEARGGDVDIAGHGLLPGGYGRVVRLPAEITLGGATLRITDNRVPPLPRAVQLARLRVETRKWYAAKIAPKKYGERPQAQSDGEDAPVVPVITVTIAKD